MSILPRQACLLGRVSLTLWFSASACSSPPNTASPAASTTSTEDAGNVQPLNPSADGLPQSATAPIPTPTTGGPEVDGGSPFDAWCVAAGATAVIKKSLTAEYAQLCAAGKATALFSATLPASAYAGTGTPGLKAITPTASSGSTTSAFYASAVKLPVPLAQQYKVAAPLSGDAATQTRIMQSQGTTVKTMDIAPDQVTDTSWARGWTVHAAASASSGAIKVTLESVQQNDQYVLKDGSLYLYAEVTTKPVQTIVKRNELTAGIQVNGVGYLINIHSVQVNNLGFPAIAVTQINTIVTALVKSQYDLTAAP